MQHTKIANFITQSFWILLLIVSAFVFWVVPQTQIQRSRHAPVLFRVAGATTAIPHPAKIKFGSLQPSQNFVPYEDANVKSQSAIMVDAKTGDILYMKDADRQMSLASLSKIVTVSFLFSRGFNPASSGTIWPNAELARYEYDVEKSEAAALKKTTITSFSASDLLLASLLPSANNATFALVESQGIRSSDFSDEMNQYLQERGFWNTYLAEPSGLSGDNVSTAREFASILLEALSHQAIHEALALRQAAISAIGSKETTVVRSTNALLNKTSVRVMGGKTGYLPEAGYTYGAVAKHESGRLLVCVLLNAPTSEDRFSDAESLFSWADRAFQ